MARDLAAVLARRPAAGEPLGRAVARRVAAARRGLRADLARRRLALFLGAIWVSHLPAVFDYAAAHPAFHETEHVVFVATGLLFWSRVFDSPPFHARLTHLRRFAYLLSAGIAETALSVVILSAHEPLYEPYRKLLPRPEHLTALADQQLGGLMMMEPASLPLLLAILWSLGTLVAPAARRRRAQAAA